MVINIALLEDVDCGREAGHVWAEGLVGLSVLSAQICCEPKTALESKIVCSSSTSYTKIKYLQIIYDKGFAPKTYEENLQSIQCLKYTPKMNKKFK